MTLFLNEPELICLQTIKWFQVLVSDTISFISRQLNSFKFRKWFHIYIWPMDGTLTGSITTSQSGPGSNGNEVVLHILENFTAEASPSDAV